MSYFDDYVADGLCCQTCGEVIDGEEPGFPRECDYCSGKVFKKSNTLFIFTTESLSGHSLLSSDLF